MASYNKTVGQHLLAKGVVKLEEERPDPVNDLKLGPVELDELWAYYKKRRGT